MKLTLGKSFGVKLQERIGRYEFEVGVLDDKPHLPALESAFGLEPALGSYAGGPIRKTNRMGESTASIGEVFVQNQERLGIDMLKGPFQNDTSELNIFTTAFLKFAVGAKVSVKRVENLLQAVVRNPILREEYGTNNPATADMKGFDRHLFDTAQMFKAIKARAKRV